MEQYRIREAAEKLGISYQTLKLWIYQGKIASTRTAGGHHRIPVSEIDRLIGETRLAALEPRNQAGLSEISGRNKLLGIVTRQVLGTARPGDNRHLWPDRYFDHHRRCLP